MGAAEALTGALASMMVTRKWLARSRPAASPEKLPPITSTRRLDLRACHVLGNVGRQRAPARENFMQQLITTTVCSEHRKSALSERTTQLQLSPGLSGRHDVSG